MGDTGRDLSENGQAVCLDEFLLNALQAVLGGSVIGNFRFKTVSRPAQIRRALQNPTFQFDPRRLLAALRNEHKIVATSRGGTHNPGLRLSPHFYNTMDEMDRAVGAIEKYLKTGM